MSNNWIEDSLFQTDAAKTKCAVFSANGLK